MRDLRAELVKCYWCGQEVRFDDYLAVHSPLLCYLRGKRGEESDDHNRDGDGPGSHPDREDQAPER